jgi:VWFA-related protein
VVVVDRAGNRVTGLTREDFALYEDGERVAIDGFVAAVPSQASLPTAEPPLQASPPDAAGTRPEAAAESLTLAILVDGEGLTMQSRARLVPAMRRFLDESVRPGDRVMIAERHTTSPVRVLLAPSADRAAMEKALEEATKRIGVASPLARASFLIRDLDRSDFPTNDSNQSPGEAEYRRAEARRTFDDIRNFAEQAHMQTKATLVSIEQLVEALAGLPGRKAALLVGGGVSLRPERALYDAWRNRMQGNDEDYSMSTRFENEDPELLAAMERVTMRANSNRVTLYAWGTAEMLAGNDPTLSTPDAWSMSESSTASLDMRSSLEKLVGPTGGSASSETGDPGLLLREMRSDLDSYYSLAYTPRPAPAGKSHKVRVEVLRPGLAVRHRRTRPERSNRQAMVERTRAALYFGWQENPLAAAVDLVPSDAPGKKGVLQLQLTVSLPMSKLVLVPQGEFHEGRLTVYLGARDEAGAASEVSEVAVPIRVPNDQLIAALGQRAAYRARFAIRPVRQHIAVSVRDELGNAASTLVVEHPPAEDPAGSKPKGRDGSR